MAVKELPLEEILAIAESIDLDPDPAKGQYFLHDADAIRRVASSCAVTSQDDVVVAGAGMGALTLALLAGGAKVTCFERRAPAFAKDRREQEQKQGEPGYSELNQLFQERVVRVPELTVESAKLGSQRVAQQAAAESVSGERPRGDQLKDLRPQQQAMIRGERGPTR